MSFKRTLDVSSMFLTKRKVGVRDEGVVPFSASYEASILPEYTRRRLEVGGGVMVVNCNGDT